MVETCDGALVVGAGPVGMSAALALDARGVPVTVLEAEPADRERPGTRADYVHGSTLEILEAVHPGLGFRIADAGLYCPTRRTYWRGREVFSRTYADRSDDDELPHSTRIAQAAVEELLLEALEARDVAIEWATEVTSVEAAEDGVRVGTASGRPWEAPYLVGADGGRSTVRREIGVEMSGTQSENTFLIVDVDEVEDDPRPVELVFHYGHPDVDGRNLFVAPFAGGWRVDLTCRAEDDPEVVAGESFVRELVGATLGERYVDRVRWVATYEFKQVTADRLVDDHDRVLLCGDAAHLFAPFGGRGMNSGVHDADAAGSALAAALAAETRALARREVENYAGLRGAAAEWNTYAAGKALTYIHSDALRPTMEKRVAALLSRWYPPAGEWLDRVHFGPPEGPPVPTVGKF